MSKNPIVDACKFCMFAHDFDVGDSRFLPNIDQMFVINRYFYRPEAAIFKKKRRVGMSTLFMLLAMYECINGARVHVYASTPQMAAYNARMFEAFVSTTCLSQSFGRALTTKSFSNGAFIDFKVATVPNLRGVCGDVAFIDEAQSLREECFIKEALKNRVANNISVSWTIDDQGNTIPVPDKYAQLVCSLTE